VRDCIQLTPEINLFTQIYDDVVYSCVHDPSVLVQTTMSIRLILVLSIIFAHTGAYIIKRHPAKQIRRVLSLTSFVAHHVEPHLTIIAC
jgi:hypothetical protein